jgi:hypothetical protein
MTFLGLLAKLANSNNMLYISDFFNQVGTLLALLGSRHKNVKEAENPMFKKKLNPMKTSGLGFALALMLSACGQNGANTANLGYNTVGGNGAFPNGSNVGCSAIGAPIGFTGTGASVESWLLLAGTIPQNAYRAGSYGNINVTSTFNPAQFTGLNVGLGIGSVNSPHSVNFQKSSSSGTIAVSLMYNPLNGQMSGTSDLNGYIQLNPTIAQSLQMSLSYGNTFGQQQFPVTNTPASFNQGLCIQSVAVHAVIQQPGTGGFSTFGGNTSTGTLIAASVYVYINNQAYGPIPF